MAIGERIEDWRERVFDASSNLIRWFMPDLASPGEQVNHKEAAALLERGRKAYNAKNYERAQEFFRRSIDAEETYAKAHYYLGLVMYKLHDSEAAVRAWKRASEVDPGSPMAHKAERKINYVKGKVSRTIGELQDRIKKQ